jgi:hypothetical protein
MTPYLQTVLRTTFGEGKVLEFQSLVETLSGVVGAKFISLTTVTTPKLKVSCPYDEVVKVAESNVQINYDYVNAVERTLTREGKDLDDYKPGTTWYDTVVDQKGRLTPWARHKKTGEIYLRARLIKQLSSKYFDQNGTQISEEKLKPYLPAGRKASSQGTDNQVMAVTYRIDSVRSLRLDGVNYVVQV